MDPKTQKTKQKISPIAELHQKKTPITSLLVRPAANLDKLAEAFAEYQKLKARLLDSNDYAIIKNKQFIKKSGLRKIQTAFGISDELVKEERKEYSGGVFVYELTVKAFAQNGRSSWGVGSCASNERDFAHLEHDVRSTAHTRAKNRAISDLIGFGEVSAEEMATEPIQPDHNSQTAYPESIDAEQVDLERRGITKQLITPRQKNFLMSLIQKKFPDQDNEIDHIDSWSKQQASEKIQELLSCSHA
ncbi:MAG: hypothetical protein ABH896_01880 [Candidatus Jacksonbacteria bacterium]